MFLCICLLGRVHLSSAELPHWILFLRYQCVNSFVCCVCMCYVESTVDMPAASSCDFPFFMHLPTFQPNAPSCMVAHTDVARAYGFLLHLLRLREDMLLKHQSSLIVLHSISEIPGRLNRVPVRRTLVLVDRLAGTFRGTFFMALDEA